MSRHCEHSRHGLFGSRAVAENAGAGRQGDRRAGGNAATPFGTGNPAVNTNLTALGVAASVGSARIVPAGFAGAGRLKLLSYSASIMYDAALTPSGSLPGTYDVTIGSSVSLTGGPEGIVYVDDMQPVFTADSVLVSEFDAGRISAYDIDAIGNLIPDTRQDFITGLTGAEGATIDPLTGDFLFSTFGGGNRIVRVSGFVVIPEPSSVALVAGAGLLALRRRR